MAYLKLKRHEYHWAVYADDGRAWGRSFLVSRHYWHWSARLAEIFCKSERTWIVEEKIVEYT